jgi:tetratricopeptide (TPR) repeat protein
MRIALALIVVAAGCTQPRATTPIAPKGSDPKVSADLAAAKPTTKPTGDGSHLLVKDPRVIDLDIIRINASDPGNTAVATADIFRDAGEAVKAKQTDAAIALYRKLVTEFPESNYAPISLFNIAAILDGRADLAGTIEVLRELVKNYPSSHESIEGHLYIAALQADHQLWADASATLDAALARTNLSYADRVEGFARKGYVELEQHHLDQAEVALDAAIDAWNKAPRIDDTYYIAMAGYYRGEVAHQRFIAAPIRLPDDQLLKDVEQKRVLAAAAYDLWKSALRHQQAYWATASGYQMSQIFVELWEATVKAPYPAHVAVGARPAYVQEVHDKSREHLEKALEGHRMNIELAHAYGVDTQWSKGSEVQAVRIMETLAKDSSGSYLTPDP